MGRPREIEIAEIASKSEWNLTEQERIELLIGVPTVPTKVKMFFTEEPLATRSVDADGDGRQLIREEPDGTKVFAHIKDGHITRYSAERAGTELDFINPHVNREHHEATILWRCFRTDEYWTCFRHRM